MLSPSIFNPFIYIYKVNLQLDLSEESKPQKCLLIKRTWVTGNDIPMFCRYVNRIHVMGGTVLWKSLIKVIILFYICLVWPTFSSKGMLSVQKDSCLELKGVLRGRGLIIMGMYDMHVGRGRSGFYFHWIKYISDFTCFLFWLYLLFRDFNI